MSILVEHIQEREYFFDPTQDHPPYQSCKWVCVKDCPRCAQDKIVALIKQKRDELIQQRIKNRELYAYQAEWICQYKITILDELLKELEA